MFDIMVVDDEHAWRSLFCETLSDAGYSVRSYDNGLEALQDMGRTLPDLVVLDIRMFPSGHDILADVRLCWPEMPVIVASSYGSYSGDPALAGADAFIEKSFNGDQLLDAVDRVLGERAERRGVSAARED